MKRIGSWYVPDNENWPDTIQSINDNNFSCYPTISKCFEYIQNFNIAVDIGTWIGDSTDQLSRSFKKIYGFEANPEVFQCAKENLKTRNNIELFNVALSDINRDSCELFNGVSTFSGWINTLDKSEINIDHIPKNVYRVESRSLDSFNFSEIDFLKIDADSHEGFILQGSLDFFENNNPIILIEYKPSVLIRQSKVMVDPINFLISIGYSIVDQPSKIDFILKR